MGNKYKQQRQMIEKFNVEYFNNCRREILQIKKLCIELGWLHTK